MKAKTRKIIAALFLTALLAAPLPAILLSSPDVLPPSLHWECPFHAWTGIPCAGCGMTRALFALGHGNVAAAFRSHPLFILPLLLWALMIWGLIRVLRDRPLPQPHPWWYLIYAGVLALFLAVWIIRLIGR